MSSGNNDDFAALDALLDQALDLEGAELNAFLERLEEPRRSALVDLLRRSNSDVLNRVNSQIREALGGLAEDSAPVVRSAGDWHLLREIGSGGTGQVFYAERRERTDPDGQESQAAFVQRAAVKILWSHRIESQFRSRFLRERRILASIDHPGLARFLDGGLLDDGRPWFAMEYVDGPDIITFAKALPVAERLKLFVDIADTVDYAHQRLIVHRDLKPQNILVDPHGRPRVLDFGIARILGDSDEKELTSLLGAPVTLQYASPEQVTGGAIDVASDVYQLGLLLYELLAGTRPYRIDETSLRAAIDTICTQVPPAPGTRGDGIAGDVDIIVEKALRKAPADRYASAAALADDLRRFLAGRPISARAPSRTYVLRRFLRRHALLASVVAVSVLALSMATVFSWRSAREARAEAERSQTAQGILAAVFEQADPFGDMGANVTLSDALVKALPAIGQKVAGDPRLAWEVNKTLAGIFENLDMLERERESYESAWAAAKELPGDNESELLHAVAGIGNIHARKDPRQAVDFFAEHLPESPRNSRSALSWLSAKYAEVNAWSRLREVERADAGARAMDEVAGRFKVDSPRTLSRIDQLMAGAAQRAGDTASADRRWASAVEHMRKADVPRGLAITLSNQALHYGRTKRYEQADGIFQQSIAIFREHAPRDTSHANVQRLYAGLLFRMRRGNDALVALGEAQAILDPGKQGYEFFAGQLDRAQIAFALGEVAVAWDAIDRGFSVASGAFGADAEVTRRMVPVFARLLLFADRSGDAARVLLGKPAPEKTPLCLASGAPRGALDEAIRVLADEPGTDAARQALWRKIDAARAEGGDPDPATDGFAAAVRAYQEEPEVFLDVLDRYQMLSALDAIGRSRQRPLPATQRLELDRLEVRRQDARRTLAADGEARLASTLASLQIVSEKEFAEICAQPR